MLLLRLYVICGAWHPGAATKKLACVCLLGGLSLDVCDTDEPNIRHIHLFVTACRDTQQQHQIKAIDADLCNMDLPESEHVSVLDRGESLIFQRLMLSFLFPRMDGFQTTTT